MKVLIIYTGGTFGMKNDPESGALMPFNISDLFKVIPELASINIQLEVINTRETLDSSDMTPDNWLEINFLVQDNYNKYDGFIVLHGTDTMSFTASALSFLLKGLKKPIVLTGAQLPVGHVRSDARDNLIGALDVVLQAKIQGVPLHEVCIYFNNELLRGNRTTKSESEDFSAFQSRNFPVLATSGVEIKFNKAVLHKNEMECFKKMLGFKVGVITFFPGILNTDVFSLFDFSVHEILILRSFGSGNLPANESFYGKVKKFISDGGMVLNTSQCVGGKVVQKKYENGNKLEQLGVLGMSDITFEACVAKAMYAISNVPIKTRSRFLVSDFSGELN